MNPLSLLAVFFIFLYNYYEYVEVSRKINDKNEVEDLRKKEKPINIIEDESCLYNHTNLCQKMKYLD